MKPIRLVSSLIALTSLSACGLRGDLEQAPPIWGEPEDEEVAEVTAPPEPELRQRTEPTRLAGTSYVDPETGNTVWAQNENGGYVPLPAPVTEVEEDGLPPLTE